MSRADHEASGALSVLREHWQPGACSPPLEPDAQLLAEDLDREIAGLGGNGARQHLMVHGEDPRACQRLADVLVGHVARAHPEVEIVPLDMQPELFVTADRMFDYLSSRVTHEPFLAGIGGTGAAPPRKAWDDKRQFFMRNALGETGAGRKGVMVVMRDYDGLLDAVFDTPEKQSWLRSFLQGETRLILVAVSGGRRIDSDEGERIFRLFRRWEVALPSTAEMVQAERFELEPPHAAALETVAHLFSCHESPFLETLDALERDPAISPHEIALRIQERARLESGGLLKSLSSNKVSILQALTEGGEPAIATEIAARLGVPQSRISRDIAEMKRPLGELAAGKREGRATPLRIRRRSVALSLRSDVSDLEAAIALGRAARQHARQVTGETARLAGLARAKRLAPMKSVALAHAGSDLEARGFLAAVFAALLRTAGAGDDGAARDIDEIARTRVGAWWLDIRKLGLGAHRPTYEMERAAQLLEIDAPEAD